MSGEGCGEDAGAGVGSGKGAWSLSPVLVLVVSIGLAMGQLSSQGGLATLCQARNETWIGSALCGSAAAGGEQRGTLYLPVAGGEALDKLSILAIKLDRITDQAKLGNVRKERKKLWEKLPRTFADGNMAPIYQGLVGVNTKLWDVEDAVRACEKNQDFGERFVELARSVYKLNDERARLKRQASLVWGSDLIEEKSYEKY